MNIIAMIQARMGSSRLSGKVLHDLCGEPVLTHVINRVKASNKVTETVVLTTVNKLDLPIIKLCSEKNIRVFAGSEEDVLDRYYQFSKLCAVDHIIRITSDCPFMDPEVIDHIIDEHIKNNNDYTSNTLIETYPDGEDVEIFTFAVLEKAWREAKLLSEREHVTPYIKKNEDIFKLKNIEYKENLSDKRWTLDNKEDFEFISKIYDVLYNQNPLFGMKEILEFLKTNEDFEKINKHIERNEGYKKSLKEDKIVT